MVTSSKKRGQSKRKKKLEGKILEKIEERGDNWEKEGGKKEMEGEGSQDSHSDVMAAWSLPGLWP